MAKSKRKCACVPVGFVRRWCAKFEFFSVPCCCCCCCCCWWWWCRWCQTQLRRRPRLRRPFFSVFRTLPKCDVTRSEWNSSCFNFFVFCLFVFFYPLPLVLHQMISLQLINDAPPLLSINFYSGGITVCKVVTCLEEGWTMTTICRHRKKIKIK